MDQSKCRGCEEVGIIVLVWDAGIMAASLEMKLPGSLEREMATTWSEKGSHSLELSVYLLCKF